MQDERNQRNLVAQVQEEENRNHTDSLFSKVFWIYSKIDTIEEIFSKFSIF